MMGLMSMSATEIAKQQIRLTGQRLYAKGLIAAGDGNLSVRMSAERWLVTASGTHKGFLGDDDVLEVDAAGRHMPLGAPGPSGGRRPSSEWSLHAACYAERPDCAAIVHAHPPTTIALALAGISMEEPVLSEAALTLGRVPVAPYATPTTEAVGETLRPLNEAGRNLARATRHQQLHLAVPSRAPA